MQRAIVVDGGKPDQPKVRYLDVALDNASGWGTKVDTLRKNAFTKLEHAGQVGITVACRAAAGRTRWIITGLAGGKLLAIGFAGRVHVFKRSDCRDLPIRPKLRAGDPVMVPLADGFAEARAEKIDASIGRVLARHGFAGRDRERAFSFTNVVRKLERARLGRVPPWHAGARGGWRGGDGGVECGMRARFVSALMVAAALSVAGCGTVTYVLQDYGGEPRPSNKIAIVRITSTDPLHVSSVDGDPLDVRLDSDTRVHVEMLPGVHVLGVYRPGAEIPVEQKVRFLASPGRTYAVVMAEAPRGSAPPWAGRVYEIDPDSGAPLHDATR